LFDVDGKFFNNPLLIGIGLDLLVEADNFEEVDEELIGVCEDRFF
jgi:hypothetical protein